MGYMFMFCDNLTILDLSNFDTTSVESMDSMFDCCNITNLITQDERILQAYNSRDISILFKVRNIMRKMKIITSPTPKMEKTDIFRL